MRAICLILPVAALACAPEQSISRQQQIDTFYQSPTDEVDILWVVDNSQSMADEQAEVASKFSTFVSTLEASDMDFHVGIVTTDIDDPDQRGKLQAPEGEEAFLTVHTPDYEARFAERVQVGIDGSDRERGIDAAYQALSEPMISSFNDGFLRSGATLSIVYVSDENDCTDRGGLNAHSETDACYQHSDRLVSIKELMQDYFQLKLDGGRLLVSAVVGPQISEGCEGAVPGTRYRGMADAFGGLQGDICDEDFSSIMEELGLQAAGVLESFLLSEYPVVDTIEVHVDDAEIAQDELDGWTYDEENNVLWFHGASVPDRGSKIVIRYEIARG